MKKAKSIKDSSPKQRVRDYFTTIGIKHSDAEKICGFCRGYLGTGGEMATDKLRLLKQQFPSVNLEYIVTGSMIDEPKLESNEDQIFLLKQVNRMIDKLKEKNNSMINSLKQDIKQMKS